MTVFFPGSQWLCQHQWTGTVALAHRQQLLACPPTHAFWSSVVALPQPAPLMRQLGRFAFYHASYLGGLHNALAYPQQWPCPTGSVSHSNPWAAAVVLAPTAHHHGAKGVGIDVEPYRHLPEGCERFYLTSTEQDWLATQPQKPSVHRLRLWTLKEAVFKADARNAHTDLNEYQLAEPAAWETSVWHVTRGSVFVAAVWPLHWGWLAMALAVD